LEVGVIWYLKVNTLVELSIPSAGLNRLTEVHIRLYLYICLYLNLNATIHIYKLMQNFLYT